MKCALSREPKYWILYEPEIKRNVQEVLKPLRQTIIFVLLKLIPVYQATRS